jgi:hypothetical protein
MASLFNTKISDTYPGLIKTLDNAAISASLKELTDGSGNQSGLFINTAGDFKASGILEFGSLKDTGENITITKFVDEADGIANNDNDTTIPTSAAVVDYVASQVTLEDLDFSGDTGNGSVDLDSQVFAITGTTNQIITTASGQGLSLSLPTTIHRNLQGNVTGNLTGNVTGNVTGDLTGNVTATSILVDGVTATTQIDGDNSTKIATTAYVDTAIQGHDTLAEVLVGGNTTGGTDISVTTGDNITFVDNSKAIFGTSNDGLEIYHDASNSYITDTGTGDLYIQGSDDIYITSVSGEKFITCNTNDSVEIRFDNSIKLATTNTGVTITGTIISDGLSMGDNDQINLGNSNNLRLVHNGTSGYIQNFTGDLQIQNNADDSDILFRSDDGSGGIETYFYLDGSTNLNRFSVNARWDDSIEAQFGASADLKIYHDGSNSYIKETGTGVLYIQGSANVQIEGINGENKAVFNENGSVQLFYDNVQKFQTTSTGVTVTGVAVADGLDMGDSEQIRLGNSQDLLIFHDGANSHVKDNGTGSLFLQGSNIFIQSSLSKTAILCNDSASVDLYYDANKKFETTNTGVSVTGDIDATGNISITNILPHIDLIDSNNNDDFRIRNNNGIYEIFDVTNTGVRFKIDSNGHSQVTGNLQVDGNQTITGDLTVNGTTTTVNTQTLAVEDPLISLAKDNAANSVDIGFYGRYNDGSNRYLGLFNDVSDSNTFKLFKGTETEPTTTVDTTATGYSYADLVVKRIGTGGKTPDFGLEVYGSNNTESTIKITNTSGTANEWSIFPNYNSQDLIFLADSTEILRLKDTPTAIFAGNVEATYYKASSGGNIALGNIGGVARIQHEGSGQIKMLSSGDTTIGTFTSTGTSFPSDITIAGDVTTNGDIIIDNSSGDPFLKLKTAAQEWVVRIDQSDSEKFQIRNATTSTTPLSINTSNNTTFAGDVTLSSGVIDVTDSFGKVEIESSTGTNQVHLKVSNTGGAAFFGRENSAGSWFGTGEAYATTLRSDGAYPMIFRVNGGNRLTIDSSGNSTFAENLGIGGSPSHPLDVKGADTNNATIARFYSNTGTRGSFVINNGTGVNPTAFIGTAGGSEQLSIGTNSTEAIRIDASQNSTFAGIATANGFRTTSGSTDYSLLTRNSSNTAVYIQQAGSGDILDVRYGSQAAGQGTSAFAVSSSGNSTFTGDVILDSDSTKLKVGDNQDLEIYHDGANSYIETTAASAGDLYVKAQGTGHDLYLQSTDDIFIRPQGGENGIKVIGNGQVELYHNSSKKFETSNTGVNVTGNLGIEDGGAIAAYFNGTGSSYTQGAIALQSSNADTPEARGQGVFMYNQGKDSTWYMGTRYNNADMWQVGRATNAAINTAASNLSNAYLGINDEGSVGIGGFTPSPTPSADYRSLEIGRQGNTITGSPFKSSLYLSNNASITAGSTQFTYRNTGEAANRFDLEDGKFEFSNAASGTAGNNITWSERFSIALDGTVNVGGTISGYGNFNVSGTNAKPLIALRSTSGKSSIGFYEGGAGMSFIETNGNGSGGIKFIGSDATSVQLEINSNGHTIVKNDLNVNGGIYGNLYTQSSSDATFSIIDTGLPVQAGVYELFYMGNANDGGSSVYRSVTTGLVIVSVDFTDPNVVNEIKFVQTSITGGGSSDINLVITPKILQGGSEYNELNYTTSGQTIRIKISGWAGTKGSDGQLRLTRRL